MSGSSLSKRDVPLPKNVQREIEAHDTQISAVYRMAEQAARQHDQSGARITEQAVAELERIGANISRSNLPSEQKSQLQSRIDEAFAVHDKLLNDAEAEARRRVQEVARSTQQPKRSGIDALSDNIGSTLDDLADRLFKW